MCFSYRFVVSMFRWSTSCFVAHSKTMGIQVDVVDLNWEYWESHCCIQGLQLVKSLQAANAAWTTSGSCWSNGEGSCIRQISEMPRNASSDSCSSRRSCSKKWDCNMIAGHLGHCSQFVQRSYLLKILVHRSLRSEVIQFFFRTWPCCGNLADS